MKKLNIPDSYRFNIKPLYNEVSVIVNKLPLSNYPSKVSLVNQIVKNAYKNDKSIESNILATYYNTIKNNDNCFEIIANLCRHFSLSKSAVYNCLKCINE